MPADTGNLASFKFGAVVYDQDDCVSGFNLDDAINEVIYQCGGFDRTAVGTRRATFRISLALQATDVTKVNAMAPGTSAALEAHPGGDTATYIEIISTEAVVARRPITAPNNGVIMMDVQLNLNDITIQAAT